MSEGVFSVRSRKKGRNPDTATLNTPSDTKYTEQPDFHRFLWKSGCSVYLVSGGVFSVEVSEFEERLQILTLNTPSDTAQVSGGVFSVRI